MKTMTQRQLLAMGDVLDEVGDERRRQHAKWGVQNHHDGTAIAGDDVTRDIARRYCDESALSGKLTWRLILEEEIAEALAESDPAKLRAELVQVAAVAVAWIEAIDRRTT